jgi:hypothetical protein
MVSSILMFLDHTQLATVGRTPLDEWSARRTDLYRTTHTTLTTDIYPWFEPTIPAIDRQKTNALDRVDTGVDYNFKQQQQ